MFICTAHSLRHESSNIDDVDELAINELFEVNCCYVNTKYWGTEMLSLVLLIYVVIIDIEYLHMFIIL